MKTFRSVAIILILLGSLNNLSAQHEQNKYWVFFTDKDCSTFDPIAYFDPLAIERRVIQNIPLFDESDCPVNQIYIDELTARGCSLKITSRWLNAAIVFASDIAIQAIQFLPFVKAIETSENSSAPAFLNEVDDSNPGGNLSLSQLKMLKNQTARMDVNWFERENLKGSGIRICINDVGFTGADSHFAFAHLRRGNQIIATRDFVKGGENAYRGGSHGTSVLSCIAGIIDGMPAGLATEAEFLLARTEWGAREVFSEEENWVAAAEWADKLGAKIINSSLGYTNDRYFPADMNGKTSFITVGANMAARKGILVVNAAGNEGTGNWRIVGAPADADSVLTVGGIVPFLNTHASFASFGPTWDLRMKPNVSAQSTTVSATTRGIGNVDGTSFASPLVAGFAACLWQKFPDKTNMEIFKMIEKAGHLYPYFDYAHGYGLPLASKALQSDTVKIEPTFKIVYLPSFDSVLTVELLEKPIKSVLGSDKNLPLLYYHIADHRNVIESYYVLDVEENKIPVTIELKDFTTNKTLRVYYQGFVMEYPIIIQKSTHEIKD